MATDVIQPDSYASAETILPRIAWTPESTDLHINLVSLNAGEGIGEHVNQALDVLLTCLAGSGELHVDEDIIPLIPGTVVLIPMGASRSVVANDNMIRYTTCHRKRGGIMPTVTSRG